MRNINNSDVPAGAGSEFPPDLDVRVCREAHALQCFASLQEGLTKKV